MDDLQRPAVVIAQLVGRMEAGEHVAEHRPDQRQAQLAVRLGRGAHHAAQRLPVEEFHRDVEVAGLVADLQRLHHVRVLQLGRQPGFEDERVARAGVALQIGADALQDDQLGEAGGTAADGEEYVGLAAVPEAGDQAIRSYAARSRGFHGVLA